MERVYFDVETDSTVDYVVEPSDHADPRDPDNVLDPILAGSRNMLTSGLQADADACQTAAPDAGQRAQGAELLERPVASQPSAASEAAASRQPTEQSAVDPSGVTYYGLHPLVSGAMFMDQGGDCGREFGSLMDPSLSQRHFERAVASVVGDSTPTTTGAQTCTTVLDAQTQNGDEPVGEYSFLGQSCLSSADSC